MCFKIFVGYIELYLANSYTCGRRWSSDVECTFMPYPTIRHIRKSNRIVDFYLKIVRNRSI